MTLISDQNKSDNQNNDQSDKKARLENPYNPNETEKRIYALWERSGFFNPDNLPKRHKEPFTIIMPPPNANGRLHAGHGLFITIEDIMIRYRRMSGYKALWIPGADHAGFETQIVYEKKLEKEGRSRFNMDEKELYDEIYAFTMENKKLMEEDVRSLGASCDWSREKFTLEPDVVSEVQKTFLKMYNDGLIYRGKRPVNWCTKHQTSLSDVETVSVEKNDPLYYLKYGSFTLATVRPETKFGDTAIAVNPNDERYKEYIGNEIEIETLAGPVKLKVIADDHVDPEFGTGVVKVTPAHDPNDFEIGKRHNLEIKEVINQYGKLNSLTGLYEGMKIMDAREKIVDDLTHRGLIERVDENYKHIVKTCYKCNTVIEPRIMNQWFVKMEPLAKKAREAVEKKKIAFIPDNYRKIFNYWMENTIDWNISRQIVWGIPIPAKICIECGHGVPDIVGDIEKCEKCGGNVFPDTDTFDTWFSSGQWPLITLSYPKGKDFKEYYPTDVMETGGDLIFKWIPRMVIFGLYLAGNVPFRTVYLHGMVNDAKGKKMSKSKGNVINPIKLTDEHGTDAFRMSIVIGNTPGTDLALSDERVRGYKKFANKIWNASRFVIDHTGDYTWSEKPQLPETVKKYTEEFSKLVDDVTKDMENHRYYLAAEKLYHYFWHTFADKIIEESKTKIADGSTDAFAYRWMLNHILTDLLKMLHPFMPFITEEIWGILEHNKDTDLLIIANWPTP